jgi:hypothetical protein
MSKTLKLALILVGFVTSVWLGLIIKHLIDDAGYETAKLYNTAVQADSTDRFNYAVDSRQGNVLASGIFTAKTPVSMPNVSGEYFSIERIKERYTQHTQTYECGTTEVPQTCTRTYYTWDYRGSEDTQAAVLSLHDREYPSEIFSVSGTRRLDCDVMQLNCKRGYEYENTGWFTSEGDLRWYYRVKDTSFFGTILVDTAEGTLKPISGGKIRILEIDIPTAVEQVNKIYNGTIFFIVWLLIAVIVSIVFIKLHIIEP